MARKFDHRYDFRSSESLSQRDEETGTPCACGRYCAERDHEGNAKPCPRPFCDTDERRIADAIRNLPRTYVEVRGKLAKASSAGEKVSGSREAPIPIDTRVQAFMAEIVLVACSWEDRVRAVAQMSFPDVCPACDGEGERGGTDCQACRGTGKAKARDGAALDRACRLLGGADRHDSQGRTGTGHLTKLLALPAEEMLRCVPAEKVAESVTDVFWDNGGDAWTYKPLGGTGAGLEFLDLHRRAGAILGLGLQRRRITEVPCDQCSNRTLIQRGARGGGWEPRVSCTSCPNSYIGTQLTVLEGRIYSEQVKALRNAS